MAADDAMLDAVFGALADPVRREILNQLDGKDLLVTELAAPFKISLQAVSRHIQVVVRAGLVRRASSGRVKSCRLDIAALRERMRALQKEVEPEAVADYQLAGQGGPLKLTQLFGDKDTLFVIHNMGKTCPN